MDPSSVERFGESLDLGLGVVGAARLQQKRNGGESYFEWQLAVSQDEGRLHDHGGVVYTDILQSYQMCGYGRTLVILRL